MTSAPAIDSQQLPQRSTTARVGTLDLYWRDSTHYDWARDAGLDLYDVRDPREALSADLDVVVTLDNYHMPAAENVLALVRAGVPVLTLADGILEYRNTFEHPQVVPGALFQPVLGHKIACIGRSQARVLESWGNLGKCEIVGIPRFDRLLGRKPRVRKSGEPFRLLIMTAKTPGFTPEHLKRVRDSLSDLRAAIEQHIPTYEMSPIEPVWRITAGLADDVGVPNSLRDTSGVDLADILETIDAVITTPSTSMLEGMMQGVPVALLDYNNCPQYVPAAWSITARTHIGQVLQEIEPPPAPKMLYQQTILHDTLECRAPATSRLLRLIEAMARIRRDCRARSVPLQFPRRVLADEQDGHHVPEDSFDLQRLYPEHTVFANMDRVLLQMEVSHLRRELASPREELSHLQDTVESYQKTVEAYEKSVSLRLGRMLTWPLRATARVIQMRRRDKQRDSTGS